MWIPNGLCLFQTLGTLTGLTSGIVALKNYREAQAWNRCAQTLSVNQCPYQEPTKAYACRDARRQMDSFEKREIQAIRRSDPPKNGNSEFDDSHKTEIDRQLVTLYIFGATIGFSVLTYLIYAFIPLNGQLCLGKIYNVLASACYTLCSYWTIELTLLFNEYYKGPYGGGNLCSLSSTLPAYHFGNSELLGECFQDYYLCQNAILAFFGVSLSIIAGIFHFICVISSCWDCHTQIDTNDWGDLEDLPEEYKGIETDPPKYPFEEESMVQKDDRKQRKTKKNQQVNQQQKMTNVRMKNTVKPV